MADLNEEQLKRAEARGRKMLEEPRAAAAHYDAATGRVVVDLANGCAYAFPARHIQDLHDASGEDLAKIEVDGAGFNLRWPSLDVDLYVPALVNGIFGNRAWIARELARLAGRTRSPKKAAASRSNGAKGRPATQGGEELIPFGDAQRDFGARVGHRRARHRLDVAFALGR